MKEYFTTKNLRAYLVIGPDNTLIQGGRILIRNKEEFIYEIKTEEGFDNKVSLNITTLLREGVGKIREKNYEMYNGLIWKVLIETSSSLRKESTKKDKQPYEELNKILKDKGL